MAYIFISPLLKMKFLNTNFWETLGLDYNKH